MKMLVTSLFLLAVQALNIAIASNYATSSHISPYFPALETLVDRNHKVTFAGLDEYKSFVKNNPKIDFYPLGDFLNRTVLLELQATMYVSEEVDISSFVALSEIFLHSMEHDIAKYERFYDDFKPDVIICDFFSRGCMAAATKRGIPMILLMALGLQGFADAWWSPPLFVKLLPSEWVRSPLSRIAFFSTFLTKIWPMIQVENQYQAKLGKLGYPNYGLDYYGVHNFVISHTFLGILPPRPIPSNCLAVGPLFPKTVVPTELAPILDEFLVKRKAVVYVAFGTAGSLDGLGITPRLVAGLDELMTTTEDVAVLWSLTKTNEDLGPLVKKHGDRFIVKKWVEQKAVLVHPAVKVFLSHGGQSSMHESIYAGKPMVVMPIFADQYSNANLVEDAGLGLQIKKFRFTPTELANKLAVFLKTNLEVNLGKQNSTLLESVGKGEEWYNGLPDRLQRFSQIAHLNSESHNLLIANSIEMVATAGYEHLIPITAKMSFWEINQVYIISGLVIIGVWSLSSFVKPSGKKVTKKTKVE